MATPTGHPSTAFAQQVSTWLAQFNAAKAESSITPNSTLPPWVLDDLQPRQHAPVVIPPNPIDKQNLKDSVLSEETSDQPSTDDTLPQEGTVATLIPQLEQLTIDQSTTLPPPPPPGPSITFKRSLAKHKQPWRRTRPDSNLRRTTGRRTTSSLEAKDTLETQGQLSSRTNDRDMGDQSSSTAGSEARTLYLPHDILLAIFSHLQSRANAQQYYDRSLPSDLLSCSRVNMGWRIAALSNMWQTIVLPDPFDRTCRRLLHLLAASHASAQLTGKNYDMTEIVQRVEVDLLDASEQFEDLAMVDHITAILKFISPFRTLSIQLPQEIEFMAADMFTKQDSVPTLEAIVRGAKEAKIRELDMPSPMYCSVMTFPGMLDLISNLKDLRVLILGYSSRDWPLLRSIIALPQLESLCVFDSCWSNQIWIYLLASLGSRLRGLTVLQGRRPLQGVVLQEGIAPYCRNLTSISIPFIQLMSGPGPVLTDDDLVPIIKACHELQSINISGQRLLGDEVLEAMADLWGLQTLDMRDCLLMTGQNIKSVRWQSIQRVRLFGCGEISQEFMDLVLQAWRSGRSNRPLLSLRFAAVLDFNADVEDPVEMGWVRQREDEPPLDLDEDHFFADWYC